MKLRKGEWILIALTAVALAFLGGFFLGGRGGDEGITVFLERDGSGIPVNIVAPEGSAPPSPGELDLATPAPVNINTATAQELTFLPGIGQKRAEDIVSYREEFGPFQTIEDIMNVSGIKEQVFAELKGRITVDE
ncbi:ComEA family DNA-binding protein [Oscillospiraceae bacterium OttesenSCG-928-G22]|nr:ComEA family DNA-binding protein [Oscillospiraceae bacterium OttesenSCG-928-G22]